MLYIPCYSFFTAVLMATKVHGPVGYYLVSLPYFCKCVTVVALYCWLLHVHCCDLECVW